MTEGQWVSMQHDGPDGAGDQFYDIPNTAMWGEIGTEDLAAGTWSWVLLGCTDYAEEIEFDAGIVSSEAEAKRRIENWKPRTAQVLYMASDCWMIYGFEPTNGPTVVSACSTSSFNEAIALADRWVNYRVKNLRPEPAHQQ